MPEGCHEVIDALDVATGWVADGPEIQDSFQGALGCFVAVQLYMRTRSRDVDGDLVPDILVQAATATLAVGGLHFAVDG